jgi:hypothetical protein
MEPEKVRLLSILGEQDRALVVAAWSMFRREVLVGLADELMN